MLYCMVGINGEIFNSIGKYFQASDFFFESLLFLLYTWLRCNIRNFLYFLSGKKELTIATFSGLFP